MVVLRVVVVISGFSVGLKLVFLVFVIVIVVVAEVVEGDVVLVSAEVVLVVVGVVVASVVVVVQGVVVFVVVSVVGVRVDLGVGIVAFVALTGGSAGNEDLSFVSFESPLFPLTSSLRHMNPWEEEDRAEGARTQN